MSFNENRTIANSRDFNTRKQIENNTTNFFSGITGINRERVKKAMKNNPLLAAALSGVDKAEQEKPDNTGVGVAYKYIQKSMDAGTEAADLKDSTNLAGMSLQGYDPENRLASIENTNRLPTKLAEMGGLMSLSPQARMNQGLMQFYQPPQRMANGGPATFDPVRLLLQGITPETPEFMEELIRLTKENLRAKGTLNQRILDKELDLGAIEPVARAKEGAINIIENLPEMPRDPSMAEFVDPNVPPADPKDVANLLSTLASTAGDKIKSGFSGAKDLASSLLTTPSAEAQALSQLGEAMRSEREKKAEEVIKNAEETGAYFGTDREEVIKSAGNLRESIARDLEMETDSGEALSPLARIGENIKYGKAKFPLNLIGGESQDVNVGDLREELTEYYTDSFYEDAPRQTTARKEDRQKIRAMLDNATPDQLLTLADEIKAGRGNIDAQGVSGILGVELKEDSKKKEEVDAETKKDDSSKKQVDASTVTETKKDGPSQKEVGVIKGFTKSQMDGVPDASVAGEGNAVDLANRLKSAKDPKRFIDTLTSKELLTMAAAYLGTTSVTEGTKAALTSLLKSREADRAHDLAVMRADSLDKYYQGLLKSQKRGQDLTFQAALAKTLENQGIDQETYLDTVKDIAGEYNEQLISKEPLEFLKNIKKIDQSAGQVLTKIYEDEKVLPTTEQVFAIIAMNRINASRPFSGLGLNQSTLINSFKVRE